MPHIYLNVIFKNKYFFLKKCVDTTILQYIWLVKTNRCVFRTMLLVKQIDEEMLTSSINLVLIKLVLVKFSFYSKYIAFILTNIKIRNIRQLILEKSVIFMCCCISYFFFIHYFVHKSGCQFLV